jgi:hypothetical protein
MPEPATMWWSWTWKKELKPQRASDTKGRAFVCFMCLFVAGLVMPQKSTELFYEGF